jgi:hypothetical protein
MKTVISAVILIALGWIAWPYYALYDFANAIQRGDQVALEHRVAWESVRQGLRDDFSAVVLQRVKNNESATSPLGAGLVALLAPTLINNLIESYVTPLGLATLIRGGKAPVPNAAQIENSAADPRSAATRSENQKGLLTWERVKYAFFSGGPFTFRVDVATDNAQAGERPVTLLFKWAGDWKLSRLFWPLDLPAQILPLDLPAQNAHAGAEPSRKESSPRRVATRSYFLLRL